MMPTPAPAGTTVMTCLGSDWMISGIQFDGYPDSLRIHWRSTPVSRAPMSAVVAVGRRRPITRSQADIGWRRIEVSPLISGSC